MARFGKVGALPEGVAVMQSALGKCLNTVGSLGRIFSRQRVNRAPSCSVVSSKNRRSVNTVRLNSSWLML